MASNITKAFKAKRGLCMSAGGVLDAYTPFSPDAVDTWRRNALAAPVAPASVDPAPVQQPPSQPGRLDSQIAMGNAMQGLSNTQRFNLANPTNAPYRASSIRRSGGIVPGSAAEVSMMRKQNDALSSLRDNLASQGSIGLADGGVIPRETPEQLMARMAAKYGTTGAAQDAPPPVQQPAVSQPAPQPAPQRQGLLGAAVGLIGGRKAAIDRAAGMAEGGIVHGPGTPTSDSVPVHLSRGEAVLPHKTVQALGGPEYVENMIEQTNGKPTATRGLRAGGNYSRGYPGNLPLAEVDDLTARSSVTPPKAIENTPRTVRVIPSAASQPMIEPMEIPARATPKGPVGRGVDAAKRAAGDVAEAAKSAFARTPPPEVPAPTTTVGKARAAINGKNLTNVGDLMPSMKNVAKTGGGVLRAGTAAAGIEGAARGLNTTNDEYARRMGIDAPDSPLGGLALRTAGVLSDVGASAINGVMLPSNILTHGLNTDKWYDYRDNFDDVKDAKAGLRTLAAPPEQKPQDKAASAVPNEAVAKAEAEAGAAAVKAANLSGQNHTAEAVTMGDRAASDQMRDYVDNATGTGVKRGLGAQDMQTRLNAYANNESVRQARNAEEQLQGSGIRFEKSGRGGVTITNSGDFDGSTKAPYIDANGNPTNDWTKTSQYAQGVAQAEKDRRSLRNLQTENAKASLESSNPAWRQRGADTLAALRQQDVLDQGQQKLGIESKLADAQLEHYKALEAQYGRQAAMQIYQIQKSMWDDVAKQHDEFIANRFIGSDNKPDLAERAKFEDALQAAMASHGLTHKGQLTQPQMRMLIENYKLGAAADKNNAGMINGFIEKWIRGNQITTGGDLFAMHGGTRGRDAFGGYVELPGKGRHYTRNLTGEGMLGGAVDADVARGLQRNGG